MNHIKSEEHPEYGRNREPNDWKTDTEREDATIERAKKILYSRMRAQGGEEITSPETTKDFLELELGTEEQEIFCALWLDTRHRVIEFQRIFYGTIDGASVHPREVVKAALKCNAAAAIFAHNHPSGKAEPSQADITITARLKSALALIEVRTLDHIVIGSHGDTVSLAQRGHL